MSFELYGFKAPDAVVPATSMPPHPKLRTGGILPPL